MAPTIVKDRPTTSAPQLSRPTGVRSSPARQRNATWIALGVVLVFGAGLAVALWASAQADRKIVLVTARSVEAGHVIEPADLREASVNTDAGIGGLPTTAMAQLIGKVARGPIPAGTPLQSEMVADTSTVPTGHVVVGLSLVAGEYPASGLRPGDAVIALETTNGAAASATPREIARAKVWAIEVLDSSGESRLFVSITVPEANAAAVGNAAATNRLRLLLGSTS